FRDQRVETSNQFTSRLIVVSQRSFHQCACIRIIHVVEIASTLTEMTGRHTSRLQFLSWGAHAPRVSASRTDSSVASCFRRPRRKLPRGWKVPRTLVVHSARAPNVAREARALRYKKFVTAGTLIRSSL